MGNFCGLMMGFVLMFLTVAVAAGFGVLHSTNLQVQRVRVTVRGTTESESLVSQDGV